MATLFHVSQSKIKQYRTCRKQFWYAHILKIQRKRKPRPIVIGTIIHQMKQELAEGRDPFKVLNEVSLEQVEMFDAEREHYGNILEDIRFLFEGYLEYWKKEPLKFLKHNGHSAEMPFELPLDDKDILVKGTIDAITSYRQLNWLTEHKNHRTIPDADERWRNVQSMVYIKVVHLLGWFELDGTVWDYIRTKAPTRPRILKDGSLSEREIDTLPNVVAASLKAHDKKSSTYKKLVDSANANASNYFQRVYTPIKNKVLNNVWRDFIRTAEEMRDTNFDKPQVRTIGRHCSWCQFEPLCRAAMQGSDEESVLELDYEKSTYGEVVYETTVD
jgi:PD-(D/E)XK nuclease superfamily